MENWRLSTYQNIQPTREVPTERYHAGYTVKKMANSVDPTYCMHMVPPNFLMHAVSHAWWGGLWFSEQAFADTVQKVLLCFDGCKLKLSVPIPPAWRVEADECTWVQLWKLGSFGWTGCGPLMDISYFILWIEAEQRAIPCCHVIWLARRLASCSHEA